MNVSDDLYAVAKIAPGKPLLAPVAEHGCHLRGYT
jgi:hypothetical protein